MEIESPIEFLLFVFVIEIVPQMVIVFLVIDISISAQAEMKRMMTAVVLRAMEMETEMERMKRIWRETIDASL